jgi:hypothetical protein
MAALVAHELINHPGRDAVILQPGREGVAKAMGTAKLQVMKLLGARWLACW